jgi:hypothetical protein
MLVLVRGRGQAEKLKGGGGVVVSVVVVSVSVVGGRDNVEVGAPDALSFSVVRPRRGLLGGVASKVFPLALHLPFPGTLVVVAPVEIES